EAVDGEVPVGRRHVDHPVLPLLSVDGLFDRHFRAATEQARQKARRLGRDVKYHEDGSREITREIGYSGEKCIDSSRRGADCHDSLVRQEKTPENRWVARPLPGPYCPCRHRMPPRILETPLPRTSRSSASAPRPAACRRSSKWSGSFRWSRVSR